MAGTPQQIAEKWSRRLTQSTADIERGVNAVTESPMEKAIAKKDKAIQNYQAAMNSGKWEAGLRRVSLQQWKNDTINKGIQRITAGANAAQPKVAAFMGELLPYQQNLKAEIDALPDNTLEDSIQRMTTWTRGMANFRRS